MTSIVKPSAPRVARAKRGATPGNERMARPAKSPAGMSVQSAGKPAPRSPPTARTHAAAQTSATDTPARAKRGMTRATRRARGWKMARPSNPK